MANLNKVMLIGRLTRDPEMRSFANGGKVAKFGFAVNNRRKNASSGLWEDVPVWLECEAFNRGEYGKTADLVEQYLRKGKQVYIEGHLQLDEWTSQDGQKRSKIKIVVDNVQFLDSKDGGGGRPPEGEARRPLSGPSSMGAPMSDEPSYDAGPPEPAYEPPPASRPEEEIPF